MKKKSLLFSIVFTALHLSLAAQTYSFKVLVNKGKNEIKTGTTWQAIKVGSSLNANDEIKVAQNSYVGLVHVSGKPIELKEAKTYKVSELTKKVSAGSSVVTKYTDFILSSNEKSKNNLQATGAVHRGGSELPVYLPVTPELAVFYNSKQIIGFDKHGYQGPFTATFSSLFGDELKEVQSQDSTISIDLDGREFKNEDNVMVKIISNSDRKQSDDFTLKRLSKADRARIESLHAEIAAITSEESAMSKLVLASFYEKNNLYIDAATAYQEAIKLAPDVSAYREYYNDFLIRTKIKEFIKKD
jgi:hypothetical protein